MRSRPNPKCQECKQEMILDKDFGVKQRGPKKLRYRVKRYFCELCELYHTQFADGTYDDEMVQETIKKASKI